MAGEGGFGNRKQIYLKEKGLYRKRTKTPQKQNSWGGKIAKTTEKMYKGEKKSGHETPRFQKQNGYKKKNLEKQGGRPPGRTHSEGVTWARKGKRWSTLKDTTIGRRNANEITKSKTSKELTKRGKSKRTLDTRENGNRGGHLRCDWGTGTPDTTR